jgi:hypothetical protein
MSRERDRCPISEIDGDEGGKEPRMGDPRDRWNWIRANPWIGALGWVVFGGWLVGEYIRHLGEKQP